MAACRVLAVLAAVFATLPVAAPAQKAPEASAVLRLTVLFRDDEYFHLKARDGTGVAATYEISAALSGDTLEGTHTGTFRHAWRRAGKMTGELR